MFLTQGPAGAALVLPRLLHPGTPALFGGQVHSHIDQGVQQCPVQLTQRTRDAMAADASIYVFYATMKARVFYDAFEDAGFKVGAGLIWKKPKAPFMRTDWKFNMEPIIFGWRKDGKHNWYGDQKQKAVFEFDGIKNSKEDGFGHPSSKPVPMLAYLIKLSSQINGVVLDGFLGSASTLMACDQLGRICYGVELEPKFVNVAVKRYLASHEGEQDSVTVLRNGKTYTYQEVVGGEK